MTALAKDRSSLGRLDIDDDHLTALAARALGESPQEVQLLSSIASPHPYALPALTTAGRHWVRGTLSTPRGPRDFRLFVKHVQRFSTSVHAAMVPEEHRAGLDAALPWANEPSVYRSGLAQALPSGLTMPRALLVSDLDQDSASIWLAEVTTRDDPWTTAQLERAAYLLGRFAASPGVRAVAEESGHRMAAVGQYVEGRLRHQVVPALMDDGLAHHPLIAAAFSPTLVARLRAAAAQLPEVVVELDAMPPLASHGDACPNNLLIHPDSSDITLIDFGFFGLQPVGFDLTQLLVGEVQLGRRPASALSADEPVALSAYVRGLLDEGQSLTEREVRPSHALPMMLFCGLSAYPFELLDQPVTPATVAIATERAHLAGFILDLVEATTE